MKKIFTLLAAGFAAFVSYAQGGSIHGTVVDGSQKTVEAATIALIRAKDSQTVKFSVADKNGNYAFESIANGSYRVSVSAVGHQKAYSAPFEIDQAHSTIQLQTLELVAQSRALNAVVVTGRKPFIEQKIDKMVVNVDAAVTNVGATALDVLEKSPGVTVDKDGNISLKGKQGVTVMMDGRPTYLSNADLTNYLRSLPASAIDQIEIMTNPSAKYDAAGNSGIINIRSKKNKQKGFNGSLTASYGQGIYWKTNNSLNLNYRTGKVNLFGNFSQSQWNTENQLDITRTFFDATGSNVNAVFTQTSKMMNRYGSYNVKLGADYYLTQHTTLGIVTTGFLNPQSEFSNSTSNLMDAHRIVDSIAYAVSNNHNKWRNGAVNLNLRHQFDSLGTELTADADYVAYASKGLQLFNNFTYNPDWTLRNAEYLTSNLPINIHIYSAKTDYSRPLGKTAKLEAGLKSSYVETQNDANYYNIINNAKAVDVNKTNHFLYRENINAAYINLNKQYKKVGVQLGLRYENTAYNGKQYGNPDPAHKDSSFRKSYGSLFPSVFVSYNMNKNNQLGFNFGRRIDRPAYEDLNPFIFFLDNYTYQSGNPFLRPMFTNNIEISHTYKGFLTTTFNYSHTRDYMMETFDQVKSVNGGSDYATVVRRGNIGTVDGGGVSVSAQVPVSKWWNAMIYTNLNYRKYSGVLYGEALNLEATNLLLNVNNQFHFAKVWSAELSGFYRTKGVEGQIVIHPLGQASAGISKQVIKGKGTLKLNVRDIFYTNQAKGDINFKTTQAHFQNTRDSRVVNLSFTYRFGKPIKDNRARRRTGAADEELNRVRVGGGN